MTQRKCSMAGCDRDHYARSFCKMHYQRARNGTPMEQPSRLGRARGACSVIGCGRESHSKRLCVSHYDQLKRGATPGSPMRRYSPGEWSPWMPTSDGYIRRHRRIDGSSEYELQHRSVWAASHGPLLPGENIHHKNGNRADNRIENLELWTTAQPSGQRVEDKINWALAFLEERGYILRKGEDGTHK